MIYAIIMVYIMPIIYASNRRINDDVIKIEIVYAIVMIYVGINLIVYDIKSMYETKLWYMLLNGKC